MMYSLCKNSALIVSKILFRLEAEGVDNIPRKGGFILASNHVSYLDPIILGAICPRRLNFMARNDLFDIPILGRLIRTLGAFPLKRDSVDIGSVKLALRCLQQSNGLLVFPEGSRTSSGVIERVKPGVGFIAGRCNVPVVPAFIKGSQKAWGRNARFIHPSKIKVFFGKLIYPDNTKKNDYEIFTERVIQEIKKLDN